MIWNRNASPLVGLRQRLSLRQADAAEKLKISVFHLSRVEQGSAAASEQLLARLAGLYGVTPALVRNHYRHLRRARLRRQLVA